MASKYIILTLAIATLALLIHSSVLVTGQNLLLFNETLTNPLNYACVIEDLRRRLVFTYAGHVPMLPPEHVCGNNHFHIILIYKDNDTYSKITPQIQQVNLYLVAFQGSNDQWYAFKDQVNRAPANSKLLPFNSSYPQNGVASIKVRGKSFKDAILRLAKYHGNENEKEREKIKSSLIKLMVMFSEAIRFKRVAEFLKTFMLNTTKEPEEIGHNINKLIHNWQAISKEMRRYDQFGNFSGFDDLNMTTVEQVVSTVGILLYQEIPKGTDKKKSKACQMVPNTCSGGSHFYLTQEYHTFDHCMVGNWWKYSKPANSTNTCSAAED